MVRRFGTVLYGLETVELWRVQLTLQLDAITLLPTYIRNMIRRLGVNGAIGCAVCVFFVVIIFHQFLPPFLQEKIPIDAVFMLGGVIR